MRNVRIDYSSCIFYSSGCCKMVIISFPLVLGHFVYNNSEKSTSIMLINVQILKNIAP